MNFNVAFIIPTGIGCAIGGHAGDATPAVKLIAQTCDKLLLNPNVVNASDINEMPVNGLYVDGAMLDGFLRGEYNLKEVRSNKMLVAVNGPVGADTINAVNASIVTLGLDVEIVELDTPLVMNGDINHLGHTVGWSSGVSELCQQFKNKLGSFDALAIATEISVPDETAMKYFTDGGSNPWGLVESQVSTKISYCLKIPVAHAPIESQSTKSNLELFTLPFNTVVDPRQAPEVISNCYLHCVLKGLHKAPVIATDGGVALDSVAALVAPYGCYGDAHEACLAKGIPVISVRENNTHLPKHRQHSNIIVVENYLEAAGLILCMKAGIQPLSVRC